MDECMLLWFYSRSFFRKNIYVYRADWEGIKKESIFLQLCYNVYVLKLVRNIEHIQDWADYQVMDTVQYQVT